MTSERLPLSAEADMFSMAGFDFNIAFQNALSDVIADTQLALDEKVRRMENILTQGTSELYRDFIDFRAMAAQLQMMCNHGHELNQFMSGNESLSGFMNEHGNHSNEHDNEHETDPKTGKKRKKKKLTGWLSLLMTT